MGDERFLCNVFKRFLFLLRFLRFFNVFYFFLHVFTSMVKCSSTFFYFQQVGLLGRPNGLEN